MMNVRTFVSMGLILVALNSSAVSKEPSEDRDSDFSYLVLIQCGPEDEEKLCSGSIPSASTVLSYCSCNNATDTKVYAGLPKVEDASEEPAEGIQLRNVTKVDAHPNETDLKVFYVSEKWDLNDKVGSIKLRLNENRRTSGESCQVLGFGGEGGAARAMNQTIGGIEQCDDKTKEAKEDLLYSKGQALSELDRGGPAVCGGVQWGISVEALKGGGGTPGESSTATPATSTSASAPSNATNKTESLHVGGRGGVYRADDTCNTYVKIIFYSDWLRDKTSSGQSIHRYSKTISEYQVLGLLVLSIVISLRH